jgi:arsenate reductase (thioredoxin)
MAASADPRSAPLKVVFVCRANGGRSAVARMLTEYYAGDRVVAIAPALEPVDLIRPELVRLLTDLGADVEPTGPAWLSEDEVAGASVAVIVGRAERCAYVEGAAYRHWPMADPTDEETDADRLLVEIDARVRALVAELVPDHVTPPSPLTRLLTASGG